MKEIDQLCAEMVAIYRDTDHKTQSDRLRALLSRIFIPKAQSDFQQLTSSIRKLVETDVANNSSMVVSRQFISDIINYLQQSTENKELVKSIADCLLNLLQARAIAYEEQITQLRLLLADIYESERDYESAAHTLIGIPLETGQRNYQSEFKMRTYLRITELFLAGDNLNEAEIQVNRASLLQNEVKDASLLVQCKELYARVLDRRGRFIEAAQRYHELSIKPGLIPSEKKQILQNALTCTLLAPPGVQRNRLLTTLFKDERCLTLIGYPLLKNMYLERLVKTSELTEFESHLLPHQKITDADCTSALQRSVIEHNVLATAKIYKNITFDSLGELLGISPTKAEKVLTMMISSDKLRGAIDQLEQTVYFEEGNALSKWDSSIYSICDLMNSIGQKIATKYPEWHAAKFKELRGGDEGAKSGYQQCEMEADS